MQKRLWNALSLGILLLALFSSPILVEAASATPAGGSPFGSIWGALGIVLEPLKMLLGVDITAADPTTLKIILGLLVFVILYALLTLITPKPHKSWIAVITVISLMFVMAIPSVTIQGIFIEYATVAVFVFTAIPLGALLLLQYRMKHWFGEEHVRLYHAASALLVAFVSSLLISILANLTPALPGTLKNIPDMIIGLLALMFLFHIIMWLFHGGRHIAGQWGSSAKFPSLTPTLPSATASAAAGEAGSEAGPRWWQFWKKRALRKAEAAEGEKAVQLVQAEREEKAREEELRQLDQQLEQLSAMEVNEEKKMLEILGQIEVLVEQWRNDPAALQKIAERFNAIKPIKEHLDTTIETFKKDVAVFQRGGQLFPQKFFQENSLLAECGQLIEKEELTLHEEGEYAEKVMLIPNPFRGANRDKIKENEAKLLAFDQSRKEIIQDLITIQKQKAEAWSGNYKQHFEALLAASDQYEPQMSNVMTKLSEFVAAVQAMAGNPTDTTLWEKARSAIRGAKDLIGQIIALFQKVEEEEQQLGKLLDYERQMEQLEDGLAQQLLRNEEDIRNFTASLGIG